MGSRGAFQLQVQLSANFGKPRSSAPDCPQTEINAIIFFWFASYQAGLCRDGPKINPA
jgi:hypothetical protein